MDNPRALVLEHDRETRSVTFNPKLLAFARHWGFRPKACAPYRARTKGKTENGVGYVKKNAVAGRSFRSFEELEAHLSAWERDVANARVHGTTGEAPSERFAKEEAGRLKPLADRPAFGSCRTLERKVGNDCAVEVDGNSYSAPWRLIEVTVAAGQVRLRHGANEVAVHKLAEGRRQRVIDPAHLAGLAGAGGRVPPHPAETAAALHLSPGLARPLADYEALAGGGF
jgi:hypothetical protein